VTELKTVAAEAPVGAQSVDMADPFRITLSSGRPAALIVPKDITSREALSLVNAVVQVAERLRTQRPTSRISPASVLPRALRRRS
jgi:hypothetical protein